MSLKWIFFRTKVSGGTSSGPGVGNNQTIVVNEEVKNVVFGGRDAGREPCNLISIFGGARQGKSFLMNCLSGTTELFTISNLSTPCTQGIDISRNMIPLKTFSEMDGGRSTGSSIRMQVGFVNADVQTDRDVTYDAHLVCPILLTSKCVLLNWMDSVQKDKILNHLGIMHKAAINVASEGNLGEEDEPIFGHLHIVFRDWRFQGDERSVLNDIFKEERSVDAATEVRNQIRRSVKKSFQSVRVWLFPLPSTDTTTLRSEMVVERTSPEFRGKVRELRGVLSEQLAEPTKFDGKILTGGNMALLVETITIMLNNGETIRSVPVWLRAVDVIRLRKESELNEMLQIEEDRCRLAASPEQCHDRTSKYISRLEAASCVEELLKKACREYEEDIVNTVGELEGELANQVLSISNNLFSQYLIDRKKTYLSNYDKYFNEWVDCLLNVTILDMNNILSETIPSHLPFNTSQEVELLVHKVLHELQQDSTIIHIGTTYPADISLIERIQQDIDTNIGTQLEDYQSLNHDLLSSVLHELDQMLQLSLNQMCLVVNRLFVELRNINCVPTPLSHYTNSLEITLLVEIFQLENSINSFLNEKCGLDVTSQIETITTKLIERTTRWTSELSSTYHKVRNNSIRKAVDRCVDSISISSEDLLKSCQYLNKEERNHEFISELELLNQFERRKVRCLADEQMLMVGWGCSDEEYETLFINQVEAKVLSIRNNLLTIHRRLLKLQMPVISIDKEMDRRGGNTSITTANTSQFSPPSLSQSQSAFQSQFSSQSLSRQQPQLESGCRLAHQTNKPISINSRLPNQLVPVRGFDSTYQEDEGITTGGKRLFNSLVDTAAGDKRRRTIDVMTIPSSPSFSGKTSTTLTPKTWRRDTTRLISPPVSLTEQRQKAKAWAQKYTQKPITKTGVGTGIRFK